MKNRILILLLAFLCSYSSYAQISVTVNDISSQLEIGKQITTYWDGTTKSINVGSVGQSSWDFSSLVIDGEFITESKQKDSSPYSSDFPDAEFASFYEGTFEGTFSSTWVYNSVGDNYVIYGTGTVANTTAGNIITKIIFSPPQIEYKLPIEYQSSWNYEGKQTIATTITLPFIGEQTTTIEQNLSSNFTVDGYGYVTMPGGKTFEMLRIREEKNLSGIGVDVNSVEYHFISKTGESIHITLADGITSNAGVVEIDAVSWTNGNGEGTSVPEIKISAPTLLTAEVLENSILLDWIDNADNEDGYYVERKMNSEEQFSRIAQLSSDAVSYKDENVESGIEYSYRVAAFNGSIISGYSNVVNVSISSTSVAELEGLPEKFHLEQNYPNPFNPSTKLMFSLPTDSHVELTVYDLTGKEVAKLVNERMNAGKYSLNFNAFRLSSGIYLYKLSADNFSQVRKMLLVK